MNNTLKNHHTTTINLHLRLPVRAWVRTRTMRHLQEKQSHCARDRLSKTHNTGDHFLGTYTDSQTVDYKINALEILDSMAIITV